LTDFVVFNSAFMELRPFAKTGKRRPKASALARLIAVGGRKVKQKRGFVDG
jgi:hypothetical protein